MEILIGLLAISIDAFFASFSYSVLKIKVPLYVKILVSAFAGMFIYIAYIFAGAIGNISLLRYISCTLFLALGFSKFFSDKLKNTKILSFYSDPGKVDIDSSKSINFNEGIILATTLSLDAISLGVYARAGSVSISYLSILAFVINFILVCLGEVLGKKMNFINEKHANMIAGGVLLFLAIYNLSM